MAGYLGMCYTWGDGVWLGPKLDHELKQRLPKFENEPAALHPEFLASCQQAADSRKLPPKLPGIPCPECPRRGEDQLSNL